VQVWIIDVMLKTLPESISGSQQSLQGISCSQ